MKILGITMRNFWAVGNVTQTVHFDNSLVTLVLGVNTDNGGENSRNGCGKTGMIQALFYGLWDKPLSGIKLDNLINKINQRNMSVTIDLERDGIHYRIERGRKPNILRLLIINKDGTENTTALGENKNTQVEINQIVGMSHMLFQHIVALNTYTIPFLKLPPAPQREVIEELLGITTLSLRDKALTDIIKTTKENIRDEEASLKATTEANTRIEATIRRAEADQTTWSKSHSVVVERLSNEIEQLSNINFDDEITCFDMLDAWIEQERILRSAADSEKRETDLLRRELIKINAEIASVGSTSNSDDHIHRLEAEAARYRREATITTDQQITRLESEARRFEDQSRQGIDEQLNRLRTEANRKAEESAQKSQVAQSKATELALIKEDMTKSDHTCSTCGQGLSGTDHLAQVIARLDKKATALETAIAKDEKDANDLLNVVSNILVEIERLSAEHTTNQAQYSQKAALIRAEIKQATIDRASKQEELCAKADAIDADIKIAREELDRRLGELRYKLSNLQSNRDILVTAITEREAFECEITGSIRELGDRPRVNFKNREEIWRLRQTRDYVIHDLETENAKQNPHDANIVSLQTAIVSIDYGKLTDLQDLLKHQDFVHKLLSNRDSFIRKRIIDTNLLELNKRLNAYLEALELPFEVRFLPDLTVEISKLGRDYDFEQLSRGQMNRVTLAMSWAFRDVWEMLNRSINLLLVDEIADSGMDDQGSEQTFSILSKMGRERNKNVFLISHKSCLIGIADCLMKVYMEKQFSRYEENAEI